MEIILRKGFLGRSDNLSLLSLELNILIAYLIIVSIYQVLLKEQHESSSLLDRVSKGVIMSSLKSLKVMIILSFIGMITSSVAMLANFFLLDILSLIGFVLTLFFFVFHLLRMLNKIPKKN